MDYSSKILSNINEIIKISRQSKIDSFIYCFSEYIAKYVEGSNINESYLNSYINEYIYTIDIAYKKSQIINYMLNELKDSLNDDYSIIYDNYLRIHKGNITEVNCLSYNFMKSDLLVIIIFDELKKNNIKHYSLKLENNSQSSLATTCSEIKSTINGEKNEE